MAIYRIILQVKRDFIFAPFLFALYEYIYAHIFILVCPSLFPRLHYNLYFLSHLIPAVLFFIPPALFFILLFISFFYPHPEPVLLLTILSPTAIIPVLPFFSSVVNSSPPAFLLWV